MWTDTFLRTVTGMRDATTVQQNLGCTKFCGYLLFGPGFLGSRLLRFGDHFFHKRFLSLWLSADLGFPNGDLEDSEG